MNITGRRRKLVLWLGLAFTLALVFAASRDLAQREPALDGTSMPQLLRGAGWDPKITDRFRAEGANAVPGLMRIISPRSPSFAGRLAREIRQRGWILNRLQQRQESWVYHAAAEADARALLRTGVPMHEARPALSERMVRDDLPIVRGWAAYYLGLLYEQAEPVVQALRQAAGDRDRQVALRAQDAIEKVEKTLARSRGRQDK